jgi:hypothetical protein
MAAGSVVPFIGEKQREVILLLAALEREKERGCWPRGTRGKLLALATQDQRRKAANLSSCSASKVAACSLLICSTGKKKRQKGRTLVAQGGVTRVDSIREDGEARPYIMELALASREKNELYLVACFS